MPEPTSQAESIPEFDSIYSNKETNQAGLAMAKSPVTSPSTTRRKASTKSAPPAMKRAASSPNVRSVAGEESLAASLAEKRRNKLGYHRTSVACGNCRRRKIRCLLASDDLTKCQNCIRLKKECSFFPVDQHPTPDRIPKSESKIESSSTDAGTPSSSSPEIPGGRTIEQADHLHLRLQPLPPSSKHQETQNLSSLNGPLTSPSNRAPLSARSYDYHTSYEYNNGSWGSSPFVPPPPTLTPDGMQHEDLLYWVKGEQTGHMNYQHPQYSIASAAPLPQPAHSSVEHFRVSGPPENHGWHHPSHALLRSMSLAGRDDLPPHYQNQYYPNAPVEFGSTMTTPSEMQPPTLSSNATSSMSGSDYQPGSRTNSYQDQPGHNMQLGYPMTWSSMPLAHSPHLLTSGPNGFVQGWYSETSGLTQVKEEDPHVEFHNSTYPVHMPFQAGPG